MGGMAKRGTFVWSMEGDKKRDVCMEYGWDGKKGDVCMEHGR